MQTTTTKLKWIPLHQIAAKLPGRKHGRHIHPAALFRWHREGLKAPDGTRVHLEAQRIGGHWCTTWRRVRQFFALLRGEGVPQSTPPPTRREMSRAEREAVEYLDRMGITRKKRAESK